jgi:hypothetical protein
MTINEIIAWAFAGGNLLLTILVLRGGTGQATRALDEKLELSLKRFQEEFEERLDKRFAELHSGQRSIEQGVQVRLGEYVTNGMLELRIKLIDNVLQQLDHRITRTQDQTTMVIDAMFKAGVYVVSATSQKAKQEGP